MNNKRNKTSTSTSPNFPTNVIGNIGLFHTCYELSRRGFNVVPTSRNTKAVDVIVGAADFSIYKTLQVKATTINMGVVFEREPDKEKVLKKSRLADFWVYVFLNKDAGHKVCQVFIWEGGDEFLIRKDPKDNWWYDPLRQKNSDEVKAQWEKQKDDGGWQLITDFFRREALRS